MAHIEKHEMPLQQFALSEMFIQRDIEDRLNRDGLPVPDVELREAGRHAEGMWRLSFRKNLPVRELLDLKWPKNWKEAAKERFAPAWAKKRWPVLYGGVNLLQVVNVEVPRNMGPTFYYMEKVNGPIIPG